MGATRIYRHALSLLLAYMGIRRIAAKQRQSASMRRTLRPSSLPPGLATLGGGCSSGYTGCAISVGRRSAAVNIMTSQVGECGGRIGDASSKTMAARKRASSDRSARDSLEPGFETRKPLTSPCSSVCFVVPHGGCVSSHGGTASSSLKVPA